MEDVTHLVLSGGVVKGIAFLGALECLQRREKLNLNNLKVLVGSSVGALIVALFSIGYSTAQLYKISIETDFIKLAKPELGKILTHFGIDSGHRLVNKLKELFITKGFDPNITFQELYDFTGKRLVTTVSCLGKGVRYFDYITEPDLSVISAVRMSISFPGYFTAVRYKGDFYVDGGMLDNVPISFLKDIPPNKVIVIRTSTQVNENEKINQTSDNTLESFLWLLWITTSMEMERLRLESKRTIIDIHRRSTIQIAVTPYSSPIAPTTNEKKILLRDGYKAAIDFLQSNIWLEQRINRLPYHIMRKIWQKVHRRLFISTLIKINT